jgi:hypothetical protein
MALFLSSYKFKFWLDGIIDIVDLTTLLIARFEKRQMIEWPLNTEFNIVLSETVVFI